MTCGRTSDLPDLSVSVQVSISFGSRLEELPRQMTLNQQRRIQRLTFQQIATGLPGYLYPSFFQSQHASAESVKVRGPVVALGGMHSCELSE